MDKPIVVVNADQEQCRELCAMLEREHYRTTAMHSLVHLESNIQGSGCRVVILDLDNPHVDNRFIMKLRRQNPGVRIIGLSSRPFHPELEEAMSTHMMCACLSKPVDSEELIYCLKSFGEEDPPCGSDGPS